MSARIDALASRIDACLAGRVTRVPSLPRELTIEVTPANLLEVCRTLRDDPELRFEMLMDVCGVDYLEYGRDEWTTFPATGTGFSRGVNRSWRGEPVEVEKPAPRNRFAVVYHLLSISHNRRLRVRAFCEDDEQPTIDSVYDVWASADWFEREAFDLFGILFKGHPDLRRILTDYGFIGHPFRKDFPLIGNVEVRYDPAKGRVIYQPVSIEPRTLVPKVIREDNRYEPALRDAKDAKPNG
jgi:NADH-quinone oxidoreductase subunit C